MNDAGRREPKLDVQRNAAAFAASMPATIARRFCSSATAMRRFMSALATPSPPMSLMDVDGVLDGVLVSGPSANAP
jgi:hypothetical protein